MPVLLFGILLLFVWVPILLVTIFAFTAGVAVKVLLVTGAYFLVLTVAARFVVKAAAGRIPSADEFIPPGVKVPPPSKPIRR